MEIVFATFQFFSRPRLIKKPKVKPKRCKIIKAKINWIPELRIISFPCPTILATIREISNTAIGGA